MMFSIFLAILLGLLVIGIITADSIREKLRENNCQSGKIGSIIQNAGEVTIEALNKEFKQIQMTLKSEEGVDPSLKVGEVIQASV